MKVTITHGISYGIYELYFIKSFELPFAPFKGINIVESGEGHELNISLNDGPNKDVKMMYNVSEQY